MPAGLHYPLKYNSFRAFETDKKVASARSDISLTQSRIYNIEY